VALARGGGDEPMVFPTAKTLLREGDLLALSGSHDAIEEATRLLTTLA
jgi:Trk K+ transport system NAD-binding subunit